MDSIQIIVLALVQGLTEFLPISSSAHLILVPQLAGWTDQGLAFDVATHFGTLMAVLWYFRNDLRPLFMDWTKSIRLKQNTGDSMLAWGVILGTIPAGVIGFLINGYSDQLRNPLIIACTTIIFGFLLWYADAKVQNNILKKKALKTEHQLNLKIILFIGCAQALALIPGTSRSGITITAALLMGMSRTASARFSFLLSIPLILTASLMKTVELANSSNHIPWMDIFLGAGLSAISAYLCIHYFIKLLDSVGMMPFIVYRLFLGSILFWLFL
ncbi:MAG: undecaprenyl-diphosphate phosphatase [gamma proteobacterium symbiont of Bathyaustriella thionipta]|nr:undecaprenyl-diphosphate phosphatase [gamma proteobacterium symbiont of Bathyaustriella thionipta]MCU7950205.1 undecaprenyl-diphosphate phosphatase [gamma proteobacterium symbiont of Bathyaustriella thionipta]MCU7953800.1 undecaprenyl-diphosphate phosphatase [gamma proteobacterium symbiont of Bathyaustriella thionipta]MCU7956747.1 undecaprenyl-diphosphate phosphatase [gamma proteobacterium symbiont of Bathyaustriella thionipta]MCU7968931.1 undecaprenyl-diphosphate phosphatase [gamma proteoba